MNPAQQAFAECHGLQCGFCTPGFLTTVTAYLEENPEPSEAEAREAISGNLCRCTGYQNIVKSVLRAAEIRAERREEPYAADPADAADPASTRGPAPRHTASGDGRHPGDNADVRRADPAQGGSPARHRRRSLPRRPRPERPGGGVRAQPHAHARIVDIDVSDAVDVDGVVAIYTHEDLPGKVGEPLPLLIPHPTLTHGRTGYALAKDEVNHVGEPIVMVVAADRYVAEDACQRIRVDYEQLPVVVGIEHARDGAALVHEDVPGNVAAHMVQENGDVEAALASAPHSLTLDLSIERSACMPMEGKGVYARWNAEDGELRIYSSTQTSTGVRAAVAAKLELPLAKVECIAPDVGGGFGVKIMHPGPRRCWSPGQPGSWTAR